MDIKELKGLQKKGRVILLEVKRSRPSKLPLIKLLLKGRFMTAEDISKELGISITSSYNTLRRYEKKGELCAAYISNKTYFGLSNWNQSDKGVK